MIDYTKYERKIDTAWSMLRSLCDGNVKWHMSIPAQPDSYPDLVIADGLHAGKELLKSLIYAEARIKELEAKLDAPVPESVDKLASKIQGIDYSTSFIACHELTHKEAVNIINAYVSAEIANALEASSSCEGCENADGDCYDCCRYYGDNYKKKG